MARVTNANRSRKSGPAAPGEQGSEQRPGLLPALEDLVPVPVEGVIQTAVGRGRREVRPVDGLTLGDEGPGDLFPGDQGEFQDAAPGPDRGQDEMGFSVTRMRVEAAGGSSRTFRMELAASSLMASASRTMKTRTRADIGLR